MDCKTIISQNITASCTDPMVGGLEANAVIINRDDIDRGTVTFSATRKNVIEALTLKTGKKGYAAYVPGATPFTGTKTTLEKGTYRNTFTNEFSLVILNNDPDVTSAIIDGLANGRFVVVVENLFKNTNKAETPGDSAFQIYGFSQGMQAESAENDKYSADTDGGWSLVLKENKCPYAGLFLYKTSYAATKAMFESLVADPSV